MKQKINSNIKEIDVIRWNNDCWLLHYEKMHEYCYSDCFLSGIFDKKQIPIFVFNPLDHKICSILIETNDKYLKNNNIIL